MLAADSPAPEPRNCSNAGPKSLVDNTCRYSSGSTSTIRGDRRAHAGRIDEANRRPLPGAGVHPPVVDPRSAYRHRPRRGEDLRWLVVAVAHHQPAAVLVHLVDMGVDIGGHLGLQRHGQHLPGTLPNHLVEHQRTDSVRLDHFLHYLENGRTFPNQRANAGP
jgi:hypothetical protein